MLRRIGGRPLGIDLDDDRLDVDLGVAALPHLAAHASFAGPSQAAVIDGEIHDAHLERARLERAGVLCTGRSHAELLLRGYQSEGTRFLERLHGAFSALIWNGLEGTLTVITDRFGMRPAYMAQPAGAFVVASEVSAVLSAPGVDAGWDEDGIAEFFAFGHFLGESTPHRGVRALPAATCGVYRPSDDSYREERYWTHRAGVPITRPDAAVSALEEALVAAVGRRAVPGERLGLSLSGGLDARTILALMPEGVDLKTVSLGIEGSLDHRSSTALAGLAGVPHRNYVLDATFLASFEQHLRRMVKLTGGQYLDQGIVMPTMGVYQELGIEFLHRGHGGELLHMRKAYAYSLDDEVLGASEPALERWLFSHLTGYMLAGVPDDLLTIDVRGRARESLRSALSRTEPGSRPVDRVWQLFLNERLHRETALSMQMFNNFTTVRMPFVDNDVVRVLLSMPPEMKLDETLQAALFRRRRPDFLRVTNTNTGARVGAGRMAREIGYLRMRVAAKLGLKGYQPYERLGLWLRRELRDLVTSTLLEDRFLDGGLFRPDAVRRVVDAHLDGKANHTFLLMALLIFGMGRQGDRLARPAERECRA
jgi:asparagine synthase (glutamine-hydrolysing)